MSAPVFSCAQSVNVPGIQVECVVCGCREKLLRCSRCKSVVYCTKEHQKLDWKRHKIQCNEINNSKHLNLSNIDINNTSSYFSDKVSNLSDNIVEIKRIQSDSDDDCNRKKDKSGMNLYLFTSLFLLSLPFF